MMCPAHSRIILLCIIAVVGGSLPGCDAPIDRFDSNALYAKRMELESGAALDAGRGDVQRVLERVFGTPDRPVWPEFLQQHDELGRLVSVQRLERAAGPVRSDESDTHFGLYREHCVACHGISGLGLGPTSRLLNPYPRDFSLGKFKYKSTPIGVKPPREDLRRLLQHGIPGTSMASFGLLSEDDSEALIDYVIYLTVRGEVERQLLTDVALLLDYEAGDRLWDERLEQADPEQFAEQWERIQQVVMQKARAWRAGEQWVAPVTGPPPDFPIYASQSAASADISPELAESIEHGRALFQGQVANCAGCHGVTAMGTGQTRDFDDWTKDWSVLAGLDPNDRQAIQPMLDLGAPKPRNILPRNLRSGVFRGGSRPIDLYRRIVHGIEGTPMPAAPMQPDNPQGLSERDVWDLVNYLLSLPHEEISQEMAGPAGQLPGAPS